jgi:hypothetical protein
VQNTGINENREEHFSKISYGSMVAILPAKASLPKNLSNDGPLSRIVEIVFDSRNCESTNLDLCKQNFSVKR